MLLAIYSSDSQKKIKELKSVAGSNANITDELLNLSEELERLRDLKTVSDVIKLIGRLILKDIAVVFKKQLNLIKEIQIQGNVDADKISLRTKNDNKDFAAKIAISIVRFFTDDDVQNIDPAKRLKMFLMPTLFCFYMPVEHNYLHIFWSMERIKNVNVLDKGNQNRRVEIVINYRNFKEI